MEERRESPETMERLIETLFHLRNAEHVRILASSAVICTYQAGEKVFGIGSLHQDVIFLLDGISHAAYRDERNVRHILYYFEEFGYPLVTTSSTHRTLNEVYATSELLTLQIPLETLAPLLETSTEMLWCYNQLLIWACTVYVGLSTMLRLPAAQRYLWLRKNLPHVEDYAPIQDVASFLGISTETLRRLRKQYCSNPSFKAPDLLYDKQLGRGIDYLINSSRSDIHQYGLNGPVEDLAASAEAPEN